MSCDVGHRHSLDLVLLWLGHRLAATSPIQYLAWELPYAPGAALKRQKKKFFLREEWFQGDLSSSKLVPPRAKFRGGLMAEGSTHSFRFMSLLFSIPPGSAGS